MRELAAAAGINADLAAGREAAIETIGVPKPAAAGANYEPIGSAGIYKRALPVKREKLV